jgi:hypothetical protein
MKLKSNKKSTFGGGGGDEEEVKSNTLYKNEVKL